MRFGLLGPITVERDGSAVDLASAMPRALLAALLLDANTVVSEEQLVEALWGETPPSSATASLRNHVMRLRRLLGEDGAARIRSVIPGYLIRVEPGELDLDSFAELCASGRAAAQNRQWAKASENLTAALGLWRGEPLADIPGLHQDARIRQLLEARSQAIADRIEAELELGRHQEIVDELRRLTADQPLHEAFHGQLMLALFRADRRDEALEVFESLRHTLVDELGVEPSPSIQQLYRRILSADPKLLAPAASRGPRFQLPADTRAFTGREDELGELIELARAAPGGTDAGMVVISAIDGMGGVGKTALAVHAAHQVRDQFPNGQLFLDLHGYATDLEPLTTGDALDWFLRSLGAPPHMIPQDLGERAAYYRDRLEGTRTLIILDNASSAAQVRPLLPGTPGCLVLVTSRKRLTGLDDASFLALDILPEADAIVLLHKVAGPDRIPTHHPAVLELVTLCGHMPLALRITASRLRHHPALRIEDVVAQLRDETARLDQLQDEDRDLTAVFDLSYQDLSEAEQHLFRLLGQVPGPDFDAYAAANLAGLDHRTAEYLLESLLDQNLLTQHTPGRYRFHDLVRVYARTRCAAEPAGERRAGLDRLLDYYQYTANAADRYLARFTRPGPPPALARPAAAPPLPDWSSAMAWLRTERRNLVAAVTLASAQDQPSRAVALTAALASLLQQEGPWPQATGLHQAAATAAHEYGDHLSEANALHDLGRVRYATGDYPAATGLLERALAVYQQLGESHGEANARQDLGRVREMFGDYAAGIELHEQSLTGYQTLGDRLGEANALSDLGRVTYLSGDLPAAIDLQERSLVIFQEIGHLHGEANAYYNLGRALLSTGKIPDAADSLQRALVIFRGQGNRPGQANVLNTLARVRFATGDYPDAADMLEQTLAIYQDLGSRLGEAYAIWDLGRVRFATGDYPAAAELYERALAIHQALANRNGIANAQHEMGRVLFATGDHAAAAELYAQALAIFRELGDPQGEAELLNSTGALVAETTGPKEALALYQQALQCAREVESPVDEARALDGAAHCLARIGDLGQARAGLNEAIAIYQRIGAPEAKAASAYLAELETAGDTSGDTGGDAAA